MNHSEAENHMLSVPALDMYYGGHMDSNASQAAMAATERRLYALPIIRERIEDNREELTELENCGVEALRHHSASLVRLIRPGMRLTPEEVHSAQMADLRARLAADEREVRKMQHALRSIGEDPYYLTIELKYFDNVKDADAALRLRCDPATVRRNRRRLVRRLALRLYGVECI